MTGVPVVTTGIARYSQQPGETAAGFKARQDAARAFTLRQQNLAGLAPQLQVKINYNKSKNKSKAGLGSFQPFLQTSIKHQLAHKAFQQFMSPVSTTSY